MCPRFTRRREDFDCANCGATIRGNGYTNHCPSCLWSRHVDIEPGDRAATCGGLMRPIAALVDGAGFVIIQRCQQCDHVWRNKSAANDRRDVVLSLFGQPAPDTNRPKAVRQRGSRPPR